MGKQKGLYAGLGLGAAVLLVVAIVWGNNSLSKGLFGPISDGKGGPSQSTGPIRTLPTVNPRAQNTVTRETCQAYRGFELNGTLSGSMGPYYNSIINRCRQMYPDIMTGVSRSMCQMYREWQVEGYLTPNDARYVAIINQCRELYADLMSGVTEYICKVLRYRQINGTLGNNILTLSLMSKCSQSYASASWWSPTKTQCDTYGTWKRAGTLTANRFDPFIYKMCFRP